MRRREYSVPDTAVGRGHHGPPRQFDRGRAGPLWKGNCRWPSVRGRRSVVDERKVLLDPSSRAIRRGEQAKVQGRGNWMSN